MFKKPEPANLIFMKLDVCGECGGSGILEGFCDCH
jgi:hypothetical protein